MNIYPLFSSPIYTTKFDVDTKKVLKDVANTKFHHIYENSTINQGSETVYWLDDYDDLKKGLELEVNKYTDGTLGYMNKFKITTSWVTKTEKNQGSRFHNHRNCMFSAIWYIQADEDSGHIEFTHFNDSRYDLKIKESNIWTASLFDFPVEDNMLMIFPSHLYHRIMPSKTSKTTRYSIAFNLIPDGLIGDHMTDSHYNS